VVKKPRFITGMAGIKNIPFGFPDSPSRHHLPFDRLMALSKVEGQRCLPARGGQALAPMPLKEG